MNDKYTKNLNFTQRLAHASEECGEVTAALGKTLRWGPESYNPEIPADERENNIEWVAREWQDLKAAMSRLFQDYAEATGVDLDPPEG